MKIVFAILAVIASIIAMILGFKNQELNPEAIMLWLTIMCLCLSNLSKDEK